MEKIPFMDLWSQHENILDDITKEIESLVKESDFIGGKRLKKFEEDFAQFTGSNYALGVSNGTSALAMALRACGVRRDDEVITVPNSFFATVEAILQIGAKPIFVDVCDETSLLDISKIENAITPKTRAIIPVHLYGNPVNLERLTEVSSKYNLAIVQDAAQAHGARWNNRHLCEYGDAQTYSFYPGKNLGAWGDAGAVVTQSSKIAEAVSVFRNHGRHAGEKYIHAQVGFNERMDPIQALVLNAKLPFVDSQNELRRKNAQSLRSLLNGVGDLRFFDPEPLAQSVYHLFVIRSSRRDDLQKHLSSKGIHTGVHYPVPLHLQPAMKHLNYQKVEYPVTETHSQEILSLPFFPLMTTRQIEKIAEEIRYFFSFAS